MSKTTTKKIKPPNSLQGKIKICPDKSITHRAVMLSSLAKGETTIYNPLESADCLCTAKGFQQMGVEIEFHPGKWIIKGGGLYGLQKPKKIIDAGNSGTTIRLLSGIIAGQSFSAQITGDDSLRKRPMRRIMEPLRLMGAEIYGTDNQYPPLTIIGKKLKPLNYNLPVASAQVKSCILLAGLYPQGSTTVTEPLPSRDHSERMLEYLGIPLRKNGNSITIRGGDEFSAKNMEIPGDISAAVFFAVAAIITKKSKIIIEKVGINPTRTGAIEALRKMGAKIEIINCATINNEPLGDIVVESGQLKGVTIEAEMIPGLIDEIPILAVAATQAVGVTSIRGAQELRFKESDRIKTMTAELKKMGAKIESLPDGMIITGSTPLKGCATESYYDHRLAMSLTIAGLIAEGETVINNTECISTSFPDFYDCLEKLNSKL
ncbi:MAG: 3-phosphoshikimate 1-carboxyvinyltransferase [Elusimicrobiota bacterium]